MKAHSVSNIARAAIVGIVSSLMSSCTIAPNHSLESVTSQQNEVSTNDYANRCGEQTALVKHEIALRRSVTLITAPMQ